MGRSKLIVQSDQMFTSVKENEREKDRRSENKKDRGKKNSRKAKQAIDNMAFQAFSTSTQLYGHVMFKILLLLGLFGSSVEFTNQPRTGITTLAK